MSKNRAVVRARIFVALVGVVALLGFVIQQGVSALRALTPVERERDQWQRPAGILRALNLQPGGVVVDLGCGVGYFALKLSDVVGRGGVVLATDIRLEPLAFLWIRSRLRQADNVRVIHGDVDDPHLPSTVLDAVLVANTYHELTEPKKEVRIIFGHLKRGGRLVIVDRGPREGGSPTRDRAPDHHELAPGAAEQEIREAGFAIVSRDDRFVDRPGDDGIWWLLIAQKP